MSVAFIEGWIAQMYWYVPGARLEVSRAKDWFLERFPESHPVPTDVAVWGAESLFVKVILSPFLTVRVEGLKAKLLISILCSLADGIGVADALGVAVAVTLGVADAPGFADAEADGIGVLDTDTMGDTVAVDLVVGVGLADSLVREDTQKIAPATTTRPMMRRRVLFIV